MTGLFSAPKPRQPGRSWMVTLLILVAILALMEWRAISRKRARAAFSDDLVKTLMLFDRDGDGTLDRNEVPERMQGLFDRADSNHDGVLTPEELKKLAEAETSANR